jgi:hypothetical protein
MSSAHGDGHVSGTFDKSNGSFTFTIALESGAVTLSGDVKAGEMTGTWATADGQSKGAFTAKRSAGPPQPGDKSEKSDKADKKKDKAPKEVKIDLEGFEHRTIALPVPHGSFGGNLAVADDGKLIYARTSSRGAGEPPSIKVFDLKDDAHEEKTVTTGASNFQLSADGKKLLVLRPFPPRACACRSTPAMNGNRSSTTHGGSSAISSTSPPCTASTGRRCASTTAP